MRGAEEPWQRYMRANYVFLDPAERDRCLKKNYHSPRPEQFFRPYFDKVQGLDEPTQLQWVDMHTWMLYDILLKADRMSMANSLELRVPSWTATCWMWHCPSRRNTAPAKSPPRSLCAVPP